MRHHLYCIQPAPAPESDAMQIATPLEETGNDAKSLDTTAPGHREPTQEKPDGCCPPGKSSDNKAQDDTDAPSCCRGKVGPCCDTSCLDRLALRVCEMSAAIAPGPSGQLSSE